MSSHALDLSRNHFMRPWKDLVVFGTWLRNEDQEDDEPCLVIMRRHKVGGYLPAVIALSSAHKYDSPQYLAHAARIFCKSLDLDDSMGEANKVAEAIHSHLLDLLTMPVSPTTAIVMADATVTIDGRQRTIEVSEYVSTPQI